MAWAIDGIGTDAALYRVASELIVTDFQPPILALGAFQ